MLAGATRIKVHGAYHAVRAEVQNLHMLSAHADADELLRWAGNFTQAPKETFLVHGEPAASDALRLRIAEELRWQVTVPEHGETRTL